MCVWIERARYNDVETRIQVYTHTGVTFVGECWCLQHKLVKRVLLFVVVLLVIVVVDVDVVDVVVVVVWCICV
jgi:hypothetical protein